MNYSYQRILFLCLFVFTAGITKAAEPFEIKNSTSLVPEFISTWFAAKKKNPPLTIKSDYQIAELIGAYPPKIYWIIEQLQKEDSPYLSNRLILYGPPGNGKSTLARAIARKAGCALLSLNGPSVVGSYLGEGAQKIRELFEKAAELHEKTKKRVVVFIDEIDAICRANINYEAPARAEHQVATQELWLALDKYKYHPGIFFICATNHFDKLDRTFLDRFNTNTLEITNPDAPARRNILLHYLKKHNLQFDEELLNAVIKHSEGLSIRTLEDLVQDVAIALLMYGPEHVKADNVWELLRETKKKYAGSKDAEKEARMRKWLDRLHLVHYALTLPVCAYTLYELSRKLTPNLGSIAPLVPQNDIAI
jgi:AAA+ superfamily predicted ATPase